jgi:hypothetical protein
MSERKTDHRRAPGRAQAAAPPRRSRNPVLALQRSIGNRAVGQVLARTPVRTGKVQIGSVGEVKVKGGNLEEWAGKGAPDTVEVTSEKGKHSAKLEKLASAGTRKDVKVTIAPAHQAGEQLNVGGGTLLEIKDARIRNYVVEDGVETWRIADFENVKRTKITRTIASE